MSRSRPRTFLRMMESHFLFCQRKRVSRRVLRGSLIGESHLFLGIRFEEDCFEGLHGYSGEISAGSGGLPVPVVVNNGVRKRNTTRIGP